MSGLIFLIIIVYALSKISKTGRANNKAGGARSRQDAAPAQPQRPRQGRRAQAGYRPAAAAPDEARPRVYDRLRSQAAPRAHGRPQAQPEDRQAEPFGGEYTGSLNYVSTEGEGTESVDCSLTAAHDHSGANDHSVANAAANAAAARPRPAEQPAHRPLLSAADRAACRQAVIYAEILGKPKARR